VNSCSGRYAFSVICL